MAHRSRLALLLLLSVALLAAACGGEGDGDSDGGEEAPTGAATPGTASGTEGGPEPDLDQPAAQFTLELEDMPAGYVNNPQRTFVLNAEAYGRSSTFGSGQDGEEMLNEWGYLDGFETEFQPEGKETDVLQGKNYIFVESHLFEESDGAHEFYNHLTRLLKSGDAQQVNIDGLANESSAWRLERDKVPYSDIPAAYSWFVFRRGNLVSAVKVYGAVDFVKSDSSRELAVLVDERALGEREAVGGSSANATATATAAP